MALPPLTALAFCLVISTGGSQGFKFLPVQSDLYVRIGEDAVFTMKPTAIPASGNCIFKGTKIISWTGTTPWFHPLYKSRVYVSVESASLGLKSVKHSDQGVYTMTLFELGTSAEASVDITLHVLEPVANVTLRANILETVDDLGSVVLTCSARGTQLQRKWLFKNQTVQKNDRITFARRILLIDPVERNDTGMYTCIVSNGQNSESDETFVSVGAFHPEVGRVHGPLAIAGIILGLLAACFISGVSAWFIAKKTSGQTVESHNTETGHSAQPPLAEQDTYSNATPNAYV